MKDFKKIKQMLFEHILNSLDNKVTEARTSMASAKESRDSDTKSSAGDKYETGRAMMQQEMEKSELQLNKAGAQIKELQNLDIQKIHTKVEPGSLVIANGDTYFISIGIGKIIAEGNSYYAISLASPVGLQLKGKVKGDTIKLQDKQIVIEYIY